MSTEHLFPDPPDPTSVTLWAVGHREDSGPYRDLCSTCNNAEACGSRSTSERPIFYCEEFDAFVSVPVSEVARPAPARPGTKRKALRRGGLCTNCDNAETCTSSKPEGGVWHCEEYR